MLDRFCIREGIRPVRTITHSSYTKYIQISFVPENQSNQHLITMCACVVDLAIVRRRWRRPHLLPSVSANRGGDKAHSHVYTRAHIYSMIECGVCLCGMRCVAQVYCTVSVHVRGQLRATPVHNPINNSVLSHFGMQLLRGTNTHTHKQTNKEG